MSDRSYGTSAIIYAGSLLASFSVSEWGIIAGVLLSALGLAYNIYHTTQLRRIAKDKGVRINEP
jgi:hypothetical protein